MITTGLKHVNWPPKTNTGYSKNESALYGLLTLQPADHKHLDFVCAE